MMAEEKGSVTVETLPAWRGHPPTAVPLFNGMTLYDIIERLHLPPNTEAGLVNRGYVRPDYRPKNGDRGVVTPFFSGG